MLSTTLVSNVSVQPNYGLITKTKSVTTLDNNVNNTGVDRTNQRIAYY